MSADYAFPIDLSKSPPKGAGPFPMYRGDAGGRNKVTITLEDSNGFPLDLTLFGTTWRSQARYSSTVIDLVVDSSLAADGVIEVRIPDDESADLPPQLRFDVQVEGGPISPLTLFAGRFVASGEETK